MADAILRLEEVTKKFEGLTAVDQLTIKMKSRTIHSLIGPNGSGKSTSINMINGSFPPTSGKIFYRDEDITGLPTYKIARKGLGRTFQNLKVFSSMSALENLMAGRDHCAKQNFMQFLLNPRAAMYEEKEIREKAEKVLDYIGLYDQRDTLAKNLP